MNAIGKRRLLKLADFLGELKLKPRQFKMSTIADRVENGSIGRCRDDGLCADGAVGAGLELEHHLLAELLFHFCADQPHGGVDDGARREPDHHLDRLGGPGLGHDLC